MQPKQKSFLDELAALFRSYHITNVYTRDEAIVFSTNLRELSFERYWVDCDGEEYLEVKTSENYKPDEPEDTKLGPPPGKRYFYDEVADDVYLVDDDD